VIIIFERFDHAFEIKSIDSAKRLIRGVASLEEIDRDGEIIAMEAFDDSLKQWLTNPIIRFKHTDPIGKGIANACFVDKSSKEFIVTAYITDKTEKSREAWGLIEDGIIKSFSVGGKVLERVGIKSGAGKDIQKITKMELYEVSVVDIPSNRKSFFEVIAKSMKESKDDAAQRLYGKPYAELTDPQKDKVNLEVNEEKNINVSKGPECPHCGSPNTESDDKGLYHCMNCGQDFTPGKAAQDVNKPGEGTHSAKWDRCVEDVKRNNPSANAYAVCTAQLGEESFRGLERGPWTEKDSKGVKELIEKINAPKVEGENPNLDKNSKEESKCQKTTSKQQLEVTLKTTLLNKLQKS
jgi:HK97 family phage prohead protease